MKILELGKFYWPDRGGIETLLKSWCEGFARKGAQVECLVANHRWARVEEILNGVRVIRARSAGLAFSTSMSPGYVRRARRSGADLWHAHFPNPLADAAALTRPRGIPLVLSYHSDVIRQRMLMWAYGRVVRSVLKCADRIVVATPHHIEYSEWLGRHREKCVVIPFGLNLDRFRALRDDDARVAKLRREAGGKFMLLNVGRLVGYKGQRYAVEAMAQIPNAVLWVVGTGPLRADLERRAAEAGVAERVRFFEGVGDSELPMYFRACDVFVFPSITPNEAFGLAQVEAMACGKPVVACQLRSGVPYVCAEGVTGLTVPPANSEALAAAIRRLLGDAALRRTLGASGLNRAETEFSEQVMVDRYWDLFQMLVRSGETRKVRE